MTGHHPLIALPLIPAAAREAERAQRARRKGLVADDEGFEIVLRPGWHGEPVGAPPVAGLVLTREAAVAYCHIKHRQSGLGMCRRYAMRPAGTTGAGTWPETAVGRVP